MILIGLIVLVVLVTHRAHNSGNPSAEAARKAHSATIVDLNSKSLFFMELFPYLIFLDLDKMDIYRDKVPKNFLKIPRSKVEFLSFSLVRSESLQWCGT